MKKPGPFMVLGCVTFVVIYLSKIINVISIELFLKCPYISRDCLLTKGVNAAAAVYNSIVD